MNNMSSQKDIFKRKNVLRHDFAELAKKHKRRAPKRREVESRGEKTREERRSEGKKKKEEKEKEKCAPARPSRGLLS